MLALKYQSREYSPSTSTHLRRTFSSILTSFSWSWDGIAADPQDFGEVSKKLHHKNFLTSWRTFEADVLKLNGDPHFQDLLKVLDIGMELSQESRSISLVPSHQKSLSVFDYQRLCNLLAGYKFAELLVLRENIGCRVLRSTTATNIYLPPSMNSRNTPNAFNRLQEWPSVIDTFRMAVNRKTSLSPQTEIPDGSSRLLILMRLLLRSEVKSQYVNIENNFLYAALHVYALNMGIFPEGIMPNLPGEQKNVQIHFSDEISQQEYTEATSTLFKQFDTGLSGGSTGHASLCAPLHLALFITPIYLLLPFRIVKQSFHRRPIIEVSHKLGPHKPPIVLEIESLIWDAVFAISERPLDINVIITQLASTLTRYDMDSVLPEEATWFSLSEDLSRRIPDNGDTLSQTDDSAVASAVALLQQSEPDQMYPASAQPTEHQLIEDPVPMDVDPRIDVPCNPNPRTLTNVPSSPLSSIPSSEPGDPQEVQFLSNRPVEDTSLAAPRVVYKSKSSSLLESQGLLPSTPMQKPSKVVSDLACETVERSAITLSLNAFQGARLLDLDPTEVEHTHSPVADHDRRIGDVNSQSESEQNRSPVFNHKRNIDNVDSESAPEHTQNPALNHKRTIDDVDSESVPQHSQSSGAYQKRRISNSDGESEISDATTSDTDQDACSDDGDREHNKNKSNISRLTRHVAGMTPNRAQVSPRLPRPKTNLTSSNPRPKVPRPKVQNKNSSNQALIHGKGNTASNPIDVDAVYSLFEPAIIKEYVEKEEISFRREDPSTKVESSFDLHAYDADGTQTSFKVKAHFPVYLERIKQFFDHAVSDYVEGMPRRFTDPETSILSVITYESLSKMDPKVIRQKFTSKNVVVTGCPRDVELKFDSHGLRTLTGSISTQISIADYSNFAVSDGVPLPCVPSVLSGVVQDLLDNAEDTNESKILNALDFPLWDGNGDRYAYATDVAAWDVTRGLHIFDPYVLYPAGDVRWGLAGLKNSMTFLHIDPEGFHTENTVGVGGKAWGVLRERPGLKLSSSNFFLHEGFSLNEVPDDAQYDFEIIALRPGDRIYMLPNTPHFVFGMENSICHGGHFYSTMTMQQTLSGLIHSFMLDKFITNTAHQASRQLLRRILVFYLHGLMDKKISTEDPAWAHLPDLEGIDGLINLLSLCVLLILGNVLDFRTYTASSRQIKAEELMMMRHDINGIPMNERLAICYCRGAAFHLFRWVRECCIVYGPGGCVVEDLPSLFLAQIGKAIIHYKSRVEDQNLEGVTHCSLDLLTSQMNNVMESDSTIRKVWIDHAEQQPGSFELASQEKYSLKWRTGWEHSGKWTSADTDYKRDGCTTFDLKYFSAQSKRVNAEHSRMLSLLGEPKRRRFN